MTSGIPFWAFSELTLLVLTKVLAGFTLDLAATLPISVQCPALIQPTDKTTHHVAFPHSPVQQ